MQQIKPDSSRDSQKGVSTAVCVLLTEGMAMQTLSDYNGIVVVTELHRINLSAGLILSIPCRDVVRRLQLPFSTPMSTRAAAEVC
jgi:hypothetical protein